jgi:hypothetical protein
MNSGLVDIPVNPRLDSIDFSGARNGALFFADKSEGPRVRPRHVTCPRLAQRLLREPGGRWAAVHGDEIELKGEALAGGCQKGCVSRFL